MPNSIRERLIGTYKLVNFAEQNLSDGTTSHPFGENAQGFISYSGEGFMSAVLTKSQRTKFKSSDWMGGSQSELAEAASGCIAYSGTYVVNEKTSELSHHASVALIPNWENQDLVRSLSFDGQKMILKTPEYLKNGKRTSQTLTWEKLPANK